MIYPEDDYKVNWDLFITIVLLFTCIETPLRVAFNDMPSRTSGATVDPIHLGE